MEKENLLVQMAASTLDHGKGVKYTGMEKNISKMVLSTREIITKE